MMDGDVFNCRLVLCVLARVGLCWIGLEILKSFFGEGEATFIGTTGVGRVFGLSTAWRFSLHVLLEMATLRFLILIPGNPKFFIASLDPLLGKTNSEHKPNVKI